MFTTDVLARLSRQGASRPPATGRLIWATAMSFLLVALLVIGFGYQRQLTAKRAYLEHVEGLRSQYQELLNEVATVRQEVATPETRLYLGGDERIDLILDLSQPLDSQYTGQDRKVIRPAALEK